MRLIQYKDDASSSGIFVILITDILCTYFMADPLHKGFHFKTSLSVRQISVFMLIDEEFVTYSSDIRSLAKHI